MHQTKLAEGRPYIPMYLTEMLDSLERLQIMSEVNDETLDSTKWLHELWVWRAAWNLERIHMVGDSTDIPWWGLEMDKIVKSRLNYIDQYIGGSDIEGYTRLGKDGDTNARIEDRVITAGIVPVVSQTIDSIFKWETTESIRESLWKTFESEMGATKDLESESRAIVELANRKTAVYHMQSLMELLK